MLSTKSLIIILFSIFSIAILSPALSEASIIAEGYDFGNVEVGSKETTLVSITNEGNKVELTMQFSIYSCSDILNNTSLPDVIWLQQNESINFEIGYKPSGAGECSANLSIIADGNPFPIKQLTFTGSGVEQEPEPPAPDNITKQLLQKLQKIINYTNESYTYQAFRSYEQNNLPERRFKAYKKNLGVTYYLIENGQFEAAYNKLNAIHKKTDGKPESNDFVPPEKAANLALMLQDLIASFDF
jgi:hypothetical protein